MTRSKTSDSKPKAEKPNAEVRRQRALQRLGTDKPMCTTCGESDPRCLELNHFSQKVYDNTTEILCRNCHRKRSDMQRDHPDPIKSGDRQSFDLEKVGHFLLNLADFFMAIVNKLKEYGNLLINMARDSASKGPCDAKA